MANKRFSYLDPEFKLLADTLPLLVSVTKDPDSETKEQFAEMHDRILAQSDLIVEKLSDIESARTIQSIGKAYNLSVINMSDIARAIRSYYLGEAKLTDFSAMFAKEMVIDEKKANDIASAVIQKIIKDVSFDQKYEAQFEEAVFKDALKKYPELGEQVITTNRIRVKNLAETIKPSIKNWLVDYTSNLGYESHDSMKRGIYLFQNDNTKVLSSQDRQKLAYILKAFDENIAVKVNKNLKQIVFPSPGPGPAQETGKKEADHSNELQPIKIKPSVMKNYDESKNDDENGQVI